MENLQFQQTQLRHLMAALIVAGNPEFKPPVYLGPDEDEGVVEQVWGSKIDATYAIVDAMLKR